MKLLLDTHAFIWHYCGAPEFSNPAQEAITAADEIFVSTASLWEITIKHSLGKLDIGSTLEVFFADIEEKGFVMLSIKPKHLLRIAALPFYHRDPFDRLLIAQAITEKMILISKDAFAPLYSKTEGLQVIW